MRAGDPAPPPAAARASYHKLGTHKTHGRRPWLANQKRFWGTLWSWLFQVFLVSAGAVSVETAVVAICSEAMKVAIDNCLADVPTTCRPRRLEHRTFNHHHHHHHRLSSASMNNIRHPTMIIIIVLRTYTMLAFPRLWTLHKHGWDVFPNFFSTSSKWEGDVVQQANCLLTGNWSNFYIRFTSCHNLILVALSNMWNSWNNVSLL